MYENFYGLNTDPFRLTPDHRFCFDHMSYAKAKGYIDYALHRAEGFVMITGKTGTGKTTLVDDLQERFAGTKTKVVTLASTLLGGEDLLRMTAYAFGLELDVPNKALLLVRLMNALIQHHEQGQHVLLMVDEAQNLSGSTLEELRLLSNFQSSGQPLLQIALIGQEPLRDLVQSPDMEQFRQRLVAAWHLEPLSPMETILYVQHRLMKAGWCGDPEIRPGVLHEVYAFSNGEPRKINLICSRLLLRGFTEERHVIIEADAKYVVEELQQEGLHIVDVVEDISSGDTQVVATESGKTDNDLDWSHVDRGLSTEEQYAQHPTPIPTRGAPLAHPPSSQAEQGSDTEDTHLAKVTKPADIDPIQVPGAAIVEEVSQEDEPSDIPSKLDLIGSEINDVAEVAELVGTRQPPGRRWPFVIGFSLVGLAAFFVLVLVKWQPLVEQILVRWQPLVQQAEQWMRSTSLNIGGKLEGIHGPNRALPYRSMPVPNPDPISTRSPQTIKRTLDAALVKNSLPPPSDQNAPQSEEILAKVDTAPVVASIEADTTTSELKQPLGRPPTTSTSTVEALVENNPSPSGQNGQPPDGALDKADKASAVASPGTDIIATVAPIQNKSPTQPLEILVSKILFGWNSIKVATRFEPILAEVITMLKQSEDVSAKVIGYSDSNGNPDYNLVLSRRRAAAVADYLVERGVSRDRLYVDGRGPHESDGPQEDSRRVDILLIRPSM